MDTKKIRILLDAGKIGSIKKTAELYGYSQSALWHIINSIEDEIGLKLLDRSTRGVSLNAKGKELEDLLEEYIKLDARLDARIRSIKGSTGKPFISLSCIPIVFNYWIPCIINASAFQAYDINVGICDSTIGEKVFSGKIDFAFTTEECKGKCEWFSVTKDLLKVIVPEDSFHGPAPSSLTLDEIADRWTFIRPSKDANCSSASAYDQISAEDVLAISSGDFSSILSIVSNGLGASIMSGSYLDLCPESVLMIPTEPPIYRHICLIHRPEKDMTKEQISFLRQLRSYIDDHPDIFYISDDK